MSDLEQFYDKLYSSTFCVNVKAKRTYLIFMKPLIMKFLSDPNKNYMIYISTPTASIYQSILPIHDRIKYVNDTFIPTALPGNQDIIYIYHRKDKPSKEQQLMLLEYMKNHPKQRYIFVGKVGKFLPMVRMSLFRYYLHFEITKSKYGWINSDGILHRSVTRTFCRKYATQREKQKNAAKQMAIYDFFIVCDMTMQVSQLYRFNQKVYKPKASKNKAQTKMIEPISSDPKIEIKYIYTNAPINPNHLIMPDGSKENYHSLIKKYRDIIEI